MAGKNRGKLGIGLPDPDLSKNQGGLPDLDLDPTRFLSRYYPPRDISPMAAVDAICGAQMKLMIRLLYPIVFKR